MKHLLQLFIKKTMSIPEPMSDKQWDKSQGTMDTALYNPPPLIAPVLQQLDKGFNQFEKAIESIPAPIWMYTLEEKQNQILKNRGMKI